MHKKIHQNIIFAIHRVKRKNPLMGGDSCSPSGCSHHHHSHQHHHSHGHSCSSAASARVTISAEQPGSEIASSEIEQNNAASDSQVGRVTIPAARENKRSAANDEDDSCEEDDRRFIAHVMGEDTDHELSLSRKDDSDMSEISDDEEEVDQAEDADREEE